MLFQVDVWVIRMNLQLNSLDRLLRLHLRIQQIEYSYILPAITQVAHYCGDSKLICVCDTIATQTGQQILQIVRSSFFQSQHISETNSLLSVLYSSVFDVFTKYQNRKVTDFLNQTLLLYHILNMKEEQAHCLRSNVMIKRLFQDLDVLTCSNTSTNIFALNTMCDGKRHQIREHIKRHALQSQVITPNQTRILLFHVLISYKLCKTNFLYPSMTRFTYYWGHKDVSYRLLQQKEEELNTILLLKQLV